VWDVSNPASPTVIAQAAFVSQSRRLYLDGDHLYATDGNRGLRVFDVSNPTTPVLVRTVNTPHVAQDVVVANGTAYVADEWGGLRVIDVTDPSTAEETTFYDTGHWARGIAVSGDRVAVADGYDGIYLFEDGVVVGVIAGTGGPAALSPAHPNPFRTATRIGLSVDVAGQASVAIFDATGRRVRQLHEGVLAEGYHELTWDGRDDAGLPVANGVYYHRVDTPSGTLSGRSIVMR
jgi:hypothetical protein